MAQRSLFTEPTRPIFLDTSVIINLDASGYGQEILQAFDGQVVIAESVELEVRASNRRGHLVAGSLDVWQTARLIRVEELDDEGEGVFEALVTGSAAQTIDDGEAATVACARQLGGIAVIDDRKAVRICKEKFATIPTASSVDIFRHAHIKNLLPNNRLQEAILNSLLRARMAVLPSDIAWVTDLIGSAQAKLCTSLPRAVRGEQHR